MKFSLVTTSLNEMGSFPTWKKDVQAQTRQPDEIVIVDSWSTDGLALALREWAEEDPKVRVYQEKSNAARGRNLAVEFSRGDVIVSTDMGCRIDPRWFEKMCLPFVNDPEVDVVAGAYDVDPRGLRASAAWADYYVHRGYQGVPKLGFLPSNRSVAYKKRAWLQLGGLPEDLTLCADDMVMSIQLEASRLKTSYATDALVHWNRPEKLNAFWREKYRYGVGQGEADVMRPAAGLRYAWGGSKLGIYWEALRAARHHARISARAVWDGHVLAAFLIPVLVFGNSVSQNLGFAAGYQRGATSCQACRNRLGKR